MDSIKQAEEFVDLFSKSIPEAPLIFFFPIAKAYDPLKEGETDNLWHYLLCLLRD